MFLERVARIVVPFTLHILALLVQAPIEREVRRGMKEAGIASLPLHPYAREPRLAAANMIFRISSLVDRESIFAGKGKPADSERELTELQLHLLALRNVPRTA